MGVKVKIPSTVSPTGSDVDHSEARSIEVHEDHLWVVGNGSTVAIYAPKHWISATVETAQSS